MTKSTAIIAHSLGKEYKLGLRQERYRTLRDAIANGARNQWHRVRGLFGRNGTDPRREKFWALREVSFEVNRGEVIGVIGRNGAGKSTLLKILSRITDPTAGWAEIRGRVGALLEVGTGFHPELTGRENVFLNGAILGMKRTEIRRRFDEIVAFAEIEQFIDTPAKHYSTGMYMRLAFAVAAHLQPDILLIDEVLAVGDAAFQKKCLGKMGEVARQGRTVLFVSHNMAAVRSLCSRGIVLDRGKVAFDGEVERAIYGYFDSLTTRPERDSGAQVEFTGVRINGQPTGAIQSSQPFTAACSFTLRAPLPSFRLLCVIQNVNSEPLVVIPLDHRAMDDLNTEGRHDLELRFPVLWLRPGVYSLHFRLQANNLAPGKATYVSDSVMLDVTGEMPSEMLIGELTPDVVWSGSHGRKAALVRGLGGAA